MCVRLIQEHEIHNLLFCPAAIIYQNNTASPKTTQSLWDMSLGIIREWNNNPALSN